MEGTRTFSKTEYDIHVAEVDEARCYRTCQVGRNRRSRQDTTLSWSSMGPSVVTDSNRGVDPRLRMNNRSSTTSRHDIRVHEVNAFISRVRRNVGTTGQNALMAMPVADNPQGFKAIARYAGWTGPGRNLRLLGLSIHLHSRCWGIVKATAGSSTSMRSKSSSRTLGTPDLLERRRSRITRPDSQEMKPYGKR